MARIKPTTRKKLLKAIELLHEIELEVREAKPFFATICNRIAEALRTSMEQHRYRMFLIEIPQGAFHRLLRSQFNNGLPKYRQPATLEIKDYFGTPDASRGGRSRAPSG